MQCITMQNCPCNKNKMGPSDAETDASMKLTARTPNPTPANSHGRLEQLYMSTLVDRFGRAATRRCRNPILTQGSSDNK